MQFHFTELSTKRQLDSDVWVTGHYPIARYIEFLPYIVIYRGLLFFIEN